MTADEIGDPSRLDLELTVNGEKRQKANTRDLILRCRADRVGLALLHAASGRRDHTGTPDGVGPVWPGNMIRATIERIGTLEVPVTAA